MCVFALLCAPLMLTACATGDGGIDGLLAVPKLAEEQADVLTVVEEYEGGKIALKYPQSGSFATPLLFKDIDADGNTEALVFYTSARTGNNVHVALLNKTNGVYAVEYDFDGESTDMTSVSFADLTNDGVDEVLIGYTNINLSDKKLTVYGYKDAQLVALYDRAYAEFLVGDIKGEGAQNLIILTPATQPATVRLELIGFDGERFKLERYVETDPRMNGYEQIMLTKIAEGKNAVFLDGYYGKSYVATEVFIFAEGILKSSQFGKQPIYEKTRKLLTALLCQDIDGDGIAEVPCVTKYLSATGTRQTVAVCEWYSEVHNVPILKNYGLVDTQNGFFINLPNAWLEDLSMDKFENGYNVLNGGGEILFTVRILNIGEHFNDAEAQKNFVQIAYSGTGRVYISPGAAGADSLLNIEELVKLLR